MRLIHYTLSIILLSSGCSHRVLERNGRNNYEFYCQQVERNREIQQKLRSKGYYSGSIDGVLGNRTILAIKKLQKASGIDATGRLDSLTRQALND